LLLIVLFGVVALRVHLLTNMRYGYFRDELYYIACARHLDFGYVDQPPLSILLLRVSEILFGDSLPAVRLLPAFSGAATVALTGLIARELGGCRWAIALACAATLSALFHLAVGNFFSTGGVALEHAFAARFQWFKPVLLGAILAIGALIAPLAVPILTPDKLVETRRHNYQSLVQ
jgi:4-amino-4-deoxy-L-arabinose transferase-like glycosyltransferase